jgi:hypothetical protein
MSIPSSPTLKDVQAFDPFEREADGGRDQRTGSIPYIEYKLVANDPFRPLIVSAEFVIVIHQTT